jgi:hypothetical protein
MAAKAHKKFQQTEKHKVTRKRSQVSMYSSKPIVILVYVCLVILSENELQFRLRVISSNVRIKMNLSTSTLAISSTWLCQYKF